MPLFEVRRALGAGFGNNASPAARLTTMGELVVVDHLTAWLLDGRMFQVRAGTLATGLAAQDVIADATAEMSADAATGTTIIPVAFHIAAQTVATAVTLQVYVKGVGAVSTGGTAFTPLPMVQSGTAAVSTARVQAGTVTVTAELATTTRRLFEYEDANTQTVTTVGGNTGPGAAIAASTNNLQRYVGVGPACVYVQVASTTAQTLYYASLDYAEFPTLMVVPS